MMYIINKCLRTKPADVEKIIRMFITQISVEKKRIHKRFTLNRTCNKIEREQILYFYKKNNIDHSILHE